MKNKAFKSNSFIDVKAEHFTVFKGEQIKFVAKAKEEPKNVKVYTKDGDIDFNLCDGRVCVEYTLKNILMKQKCTLKPWKDLPVINRAFI